MNKYLLLCVLVVCSVHAQAACTVEWPALPFQKMELMKAVSAANEGAAVADIVIAAPGLATVSFVGQNKRREKAIIVFEARSAECAAKPEDLVRNPTLFRVLSYQLQPSIQRK